MHAACFRHGARLVARDQLDDGAGKASAEAIGGVERQQPALVQQRDTRAALRLVQIGRADKNGDPLVQELRQQLPELASRDGIDTRRRLVEHDEPRLVHERAGERELLLHASREPVGQAIAEGRELRELQQPFAARLIAAQSMNLGEEGNVLVDAEIAIETEAL